VEDPAAWFQRLIGREDHGAMPTVTLK